MGGVRGGDNDGGRVLGPPQICKLLHRESERGRGGCRVCVRSHRECVGVFIERRGACVEYAVEGLPLHQLEVVLDQCGDVFCFSDHFR